jgi:carboxymethylenebutenolidase
MRGMEVVVPGRGGAPDTPGWAVLPAGATRGVVVVHEAFGRQPEIDRVVDRFGAAGYAAVAPDLFARGFARCVVRAMAQMRSGRGEMFDQLRDARAWLAAQAGIGEERIAIIGFCMGGAFALAAGPGWGAVSANYGVVGEPAVVGTGGPVLACYGNRDPMSRTEPARLRRILDESGRVGEVRVVEGVSHSFLTDGQHVWNGPLLGGLLRLRYDAEVAERTWADIFAFFDRHLPVTA